MAIAVAQFAEVADWFSSTTPRNISGLNWSAGDIIVVAIGDENTGAGPLTPSNANLAFGSALVLQDSGPGSECDCSVFAATAGSSQSGQSISCARGGGVFNFGAAAWVVSGASAVGNVSANDNVTEAAISLTVSAGSLVIYAAMDFAAAAAGSTLTTGSGTATERRDASDGSTYGQRLGEWLNTAAGTFSFGLTSYAGLTIAHVAIEILASAAATPIPFRNLIPQRRRRYPL